eukprot:TRINITY_DN26013_c0_g1_i1.p1 TRINITY_DN26013_c0_g1~~TRINITY_DN26013_c0_g1_i1.p1  ORF type:complete len:180 (+),score=24.24 TRINITY_DN26013_c0_g1_i1:97-636(+)
MSMPKVAGACGAGDGGNFGALMMSFDSTSEEEEKRTASDDETRFLMLILAAARASQRDFDLDGQCSDQTTSAESLQCMERARKRRKGRWKDDDAQRVGNKMAWELERRCRRRNGRGWRCKEQSIPGYSLCKYHAEKCCRFKSLGATLTSAAEERKKPLKRKSLRDIPRTSDALAQAQKG